MEDGKVRDEVVGGSVEPSRSAEVSTWRVLAQLTFEKCFPGLLGLASDPPDGTLTGRLPPADMNIYKHY